MYSTSVFITFPRDSWRKCVIWREQTGFCPRHGGGQLDDDHYLPPPVLRLPFLWHLGHGYKGERNRCCLHRNLLLLIEMVLKMYLKYLKHGGTKSALFAIFQTKWEGPQETSSGSCNVKQRMQRKQLFPLEQWIITDVWW